ncbi:MAG: SMC-Scp complex subunit ScpB [Planctomycetota bacterium]
MPKEDPANNEAIPESPLELVEPQEADLPSEDDPVVLEKLLQNPKPILEALLFSTREPLTSQRLRHLLRGAEIEDMGTLVASLNADLEARGASVRAERVGGGWLLMTLPEFSPWIRRLFKHKTETRLSQAALETLAVVAYRQPITRAEVDAIRGVSSGPLMKSLLEKGLLKITGQAETVGRPLLYGTTQKFLETFGLADLKALPGPDSSLTA